MTPILLIVIALLAVLVWRKEDQCKSLEASQASEKILLELTRKDSDRYQARWELECAGREQDATEARDAISTLEMVLENERQIAHLQTERIKSTQQRLDFAQQRIIRDELKIEELVKTNAELSKMVGARSRKLQEYANVCGDFVQYLKASGTRWTNRHPRLHQIACAFRDLSEERV